jgi:lysine 6-dehydrogenase
MIKILYKLVNMRVMVLGAGLMGEAIVYDLANNKGVGKICVVDNDNRKLKYLGKKFADRNLEFVCIDVKKIKKVIDGYNIVISALPFVFNLWLTGVSIDKGCHFCDLGGNWQTVQKQLKLNRKAKRKKVCVIPDCGLAPGISNVVCADAVRRLKYIENLKIFVGGVPQKPVPPLYYQPVFSYEGLINEYTRRCRILRDGKIRYTKPLTETEPVEISDFPADLEACHTSGGSSTLPVTLNRYVKNLVYKTIRYKGHYDFVKKFSIPELLRLLKRRAPGKEVKDVVLFKVVAQTKRGGIFYEMVDYYDKKTGFTAMQRTTGFSTAVIAWMLEAGEIKKRGVVAPEQCVPAEKFFSQLHERNMIIKIAPL